MQNQKNNRDGGKSQFGNYELVRRIDVGGMGEVYLARQRTAFGRAVAIKIMRSDLVHDRTARQRFMREAEVNAHLKHEHILQLIEFGEEQGRLFIVTPYIEGGTLARRLQNGQLSLAEVHEIFVALVQAVIYIHRRGVIHRDLKPGNILLDEGSDGRVYVRLIDFGIATIQGQQASPPLTASGDEMGTLAYLAPERMSGVAAPSNDIFSLGVILYQMLTGRLPRPDQTLTNLPEPLEYVVRRATATRPQERYASAEELLKDFESAYQYVMANDETAPTEKPGSGASFPARESAASAPSRPPRPAASSRPEVMTLQRAEDTPPESGLAGPGSFERDDYSAPTVNLSRAALQEPQKSKSSPGQTPRPPRTRKRRSSLFAIVTIVVALILLVMAGLLVMEVTALSNVSINITPRMAAISKVFTLTAKTTTKQADANGPSIPAQVLSETKTTSQQGETTGRKCTLGIFNCKPAVDIGDQVRLLNQAKQTLVGQITQDLKSKLHAKDAQQVGDIVFNDINVVSSPPVGTQSSTVTVTLTEQGSVEYFLKADVRSVVQTLLARQLQQQMGTGYQFKNIQIGQAVIANVDNNGTVTLKVPAAGAAQYVFSSAQLQAIKEHIKGMKANAARAYLQKQPGIDANSVAIHFANSSADTLPDDPQHIQIIPVNPSNLPPAQLPSIKGATPTATSQT